MFTTLDGWTLVHQYQWGTVRINASRACLCPGSAPCGTMYLLLRRYPSSLCVVICPSNESIFAPDIRRDTSWKCPNCHFEVLVSEVGKNACPNCAFFPPRWHSDLEDGPRD